MKKIVFTFDDGREDNYSVVFPLMSHYNLTGTIFVTTGFVDGTWEKPESWKSAEKPLSIDQIIDLKKNGWEIGLHGDRHTTELKDTLLSIEKMNHWLGEENTYGFSMPNSVAVENELQSFIQGCSGKICYMRRGRKRNTKKLSSKILYGLYRFLGSNEAYQKFNSVNWMQQSKINKNEVYSVVIRSEDNPYMIIKFIDQIPDNTIVVFMLHSVLDKTHPLFNADPWCWSKENFKIFCEELSKRIEKNELKVENLKNALEEENHD